MGKEVSRSSKNLDDHKILIVIFERRLKDKRKQENKSICNSKNKFSTERRSRTNIDDREVGHLSDN